jgi:nucleotide-binding universal stress UspA family protein
MIKSILVALDGSAYTDPALKHAIMLSKKFEAFLRVLTVIDIRIFEWAVAIGVEGFAPIIPSSGYQEESQKLLDQKAQEILNKAEKILDSYDLEYITEKESGNPIDVICEKAKLCDILIMGARGEFAKWSDKMLGATLEAISRLSIKPVFVSPKDFREIKKVMIAYDGSENASKALQLSAFFASKLELPLLLLNVSESQETGDKILQEARDYLAPYKIPGLTEKITAGDADDQIVQVSQQENVDLIIMGSYGHSRIREAILGSTTVQTMRRVNIPILMAR